MAGMITGAVAGVGSTYNFLPKQIHSILKLLEEGKLKDARLPQWRVQQTCRIMYKYGIIRYCFNPAVCNVSQSKTE